VTRRDALKAAAAAVTCRVAFAKAAQPATRVNFMVPAGACDCHTHIFGDPVQFPFSPARIYTPEPALPDEMSKLHRSLHMERVVIVNPSVYGTDNAATLYGMKARGGTARGVAVIGDKTPESELDVMHRAGIRGIRINLVQAGQADPALGRKLFESAVARAKQRNWHVQMYTTLQVIAGIRDLVQTSPVPVVFDHFGGAQAALGLPQPGFADLIELVRMGKAYVKISGAYRSSKMAPDYPDVAPFAQALIAANPDRIVWGSDWPHPDSDRIPGRKPTDLAPLLPIDDGRLLNQLPLWAPEAEVRRRILVDNPARLYQF